MVFILAVMEMKMKIGGAKVNILYCLMKRNVTRLTQL